jgi:hypothetical protein
MDQPVNAVETLVSQYKEGYKTTEFWAAIAAAVGPAVAAAIDGSGPLADQLSNVTWVAIAYILSRAGIKVARATAQAKVATTVAETEPVTTLETAEFWPVEETAANGNGFDPYEALLNLRERGILTDDQFEQASTRATLNV